MDREKRPHWMIVTFVTAAITAAVNQAVAVVPLLGAGIAHIRWSTVGILALSVLVESILLFGVFVLGIRYSLYTLKILLLTLFTGKARIPKWICPLERAIWRAAGLMRSRTKNTPRRKGVTNEIYTGQSGRGSETLWADRH